MGLSAVAADAKSRATWGDFNELLYALVTMSVNHPDPKSPIEEIIKEKSDLVSLRFLKAHRITHPDFGMPVEVIYLRSGDKERLTADTHALVSLIRADLPPYVGAVLIVDRKEIGFTGGETTRPKWSLVYWRHPDGSFEGATTKPRKYIRQRIKNAPSEYIEAYWTLIEGLRLVADGRSERATKKLWWVWETLKHARQDTSGLAFQALIVLARETSERHRAKERGRYLQLLARELKKRGADERLGKIFRFVPALYPEASYNDPVAGEVKLRVTANRYGQVTKVEVLVENPRGRGFGESARQAAKDWVLIPKLSDSGEVLERFTIEEEIVFKAPSPDQIRTLELMRKFMR